jgi:Tfp pilus assembly protein PilN
MIRINLLGRPRPRVKRRVAVTGTLQLMLFVIPVGLALGLLAADWYYTNNQITDLNKKIEQKKVERAQLAQLEKEVEAFKAKEKRLEGRIKVITDLKRNQSGPVQMLQAIGHTISLTETLWLTSMKETGGNRVEFKGIAGSLTAVADFITNLDGSGYFENVEMKESIQQPPQRGVSNFTFTLTAKFSLPAPPEAEGGSEGQTPAAAGGQQ